jgi:hypothetical protein
MIDRVPICPHCDAAWSEGPVVKEDSIHEVRIVSCPSCSKVIAVLPATVFTVDLS